VVAATVVPGYTRRKLPDAAGAGWSTAPRGANRPLPGRCRPTLADTGTAMAKAKKKMGRPKGEVTYTKSVRIDDGLAHKARMIAAEKKLSFAEYIDSIIRGRILADWEKAINKVADEG
jgi:hypothetical protein